MTSTAPRAGTPRRYDVAIRGTGVVGLTLALLLARDRLRVALVGPRAAPTDTPDVRAYALNAAARQVLESVRAWPDDSASPPTVTPVHAMQVWGDHGGELRFDAGVVGVPSLTWIVDVPALEARLREAVGFQAGIDWLDDAPPAALTVVCEGKHSRTRQALGIEFDVKPYGHKAVAARLQAEQPHGGVARQWFVQGQIMALLPLGGALGNLVALVWSVPGEQADAWLAGPPQALADAVTERSHGVLGQLQMQSPAQAWPLESSRARHWIAHTPSGSVALAGDAAHAMHPLAGQGLNLGLGDAAELARVLHGREYWRELGDAKLLRRYERARQADVQAMAWLTEGLFGLFDHADARVQALRNWGLSAFDRSGPLKRWLARQAMGPAL